jgi:hypothetical protein
MGCTRAVISRSVGPQFAVANINLETSTTLKTHGVNSVGTDFLRKGTHMHERVKQEGCLTLMIAREHIG